VQEWVDPRNGKAWRPFYNCGTDSEATATGLSPGEYRVTAAAGAGPTPLAVSEIIRLDGSSRTTRITLQLEAGASLSVSAIDTSTKKLLPLFQALLIRDDGLPIVPWSSFPWIMRSRNEEGRLTFPQLPAGRYRLDIRSRAFYASEPEYVTEQGPLELAIVAGQDREIAIALKPVDLPEETVRQRWPWVVKGRVVGEQGQGLPGVTITAHCGMGSLFPTGQTQTGSNGVYTLRFAPGFTSRDPVALQVATISPAKPGYTETNLHRQGDLLMAKRLPAPGERTGWNPDPSRVVLPEQPFTLDFVMAPAASVRGRLMDESNRPLPRQRIDLSGRELPPSCSVLAEVTTDHDGRFNFDGIPVRRAWWFLLSGKDRLQSETVTFDKPAAHEVVLRIRERDGKPCLDVTRPTE